LKTSREAAYVSKTKEKKPKENLRTWIHNMSVNYFFLFVGLREMENSRAIGPTSSIFSPLLPQSTPYPPSKPMSSLLSIIPVAQKSNFCPSLDCYKKIL